MDLYTQRGGGLIGCYSGHVLGAGFRQPERGLSVLIGHIDAYLRIRNTQDVKGRLEWRRRSPFAMSGVCVYLFIRIC